MDENRTPSWRWRGRFHRKGFFGPCSFFITRPTFDLLRLENEDARHLAAGLKSILEAFANKGAEQIKFNRVDWDTNGLTLDSLLLHWDQIIEHKEKFTDEDGEQRPSRWSFFVYGPFDAADEMPDNNNGFIIHAQKIETEDKQVVIHDIDIRNAFPTKEHLPPLSLIKKWGKGATGISNLNTAITDFIQDEFSFETVILDSELDPNLARVLPSDILMQMNGEDKCRNIVRREFAEVRMSSNPEHVSHEQARAIDEIDYISSPSMSYIGRPGTGKTTIAHVSACEVILQPGPGFGSRNILYVVTTDALKIKAKKEISGILTHVYGLDDSTLNAILDEKNDRYGNLLILSENDLIKELPQPVERLNQRTLKEIIQQSIEGEEEEIRNIWLDSEKEHELLRVLRTFVYGLFGSPHNFVRRIDKMGRDEKRLKEFFETPINLLYPEDENKNASHDVKPSHFWNPWVGRSDADAKKLVWQLADLLSLDDSILKMKLFEGDFNERRDGHWTPTSIAYAIFKKVQYQQDAFSEDMGDWTEYKNEFDAIIIDECQDIDVQMISCLLRGFSRRSPHTKYNNRPFVLIASGDPLQTIRGSLFQSDLNHINAVFEDWKEDIHNRTGETEPSAAEGLPTFRRRKLNANYRNAEPIIEVVNRSIEIMAEVASNELGQKRQIGIQKPDSSRKGAAIFHKWGGSNSSLDLWKSVFKQLRIQLENSIRGFGEDEILSEPTTVLILPHEDMKEVIEEIEANRNPVLFWPDMNNEMNEDPLLDEWKNTTEEISRLISVLKKKGRKPETMIRALETAGIQNVEGIKGLTVPVCISAGFGKIIDQYRGKGDQGSIYAKMVALSNSLVANSRPQFGLFVLDNNPDALFGEKHPEELFKSNNITLDEMDAILKKVALSIDLEHKLFRVIDQPNQIQDLITLRLFISRVKTERWSTDEDRKKATVCEKILNFFDSIYRENDSNPLKCLEELEEAGHKYRNQAREMYIETFFDKRDINRMKHLFEWKNLLENPTEEKSTRDSSDLNTEGRQYIRRLWNVLRGVGEQNDFDSCYKVEQIPFFEGGWQYPIPEHWDGKKKTRMTSMYLPELDQVRVSLKVGQRWYIPKPKIDSQGIWMTNPGMIAIQHHYIVEKLKSLLEISTDTSTDSNIRAIIWSILAGNSDADGLIEMVLKSKVDDNERFRWIDWLFNAALEPENVLVRNIRQKLKEQTHDKEFKNLINEWLQSKPKIMTDRMEWLQELDNIFSQQRTKRAPKWLKSWLVPKQLNELLQLWIESNAIASSSVIDVNTINQLNLFHSFAIKINDSEMSEAIKTTLDISRASNPDEGIRSGNPGAVLSAIVRASVTDGNSSKCPPFESIIKLNLFTRGLSKSFVDLISMDITQDIMREEKWFGRFMQGEGGNDSGWVALLHWLRKHEEENSSIKRKWGTTERIVYELDRFVISGRKEAMTRNFITGTKITQMFNTLDAMTLPRIYGLFDDPHTVSSAYWLEYARKYLMGTNGWRQNPHFWVASPLTKQRNMEKNYWAQYPISTTNYRKQRGKPRDSRNKNSEFHITGSTLAAYIIAFHSNIQNGDEKWNIEILQEIKGLFRGGGAYQEEALLNILIAIQNEKSGEKGSLKKAIIDSLNYRMTTYARHVIPRRKKGGGRIISHDTSRGPWGVHMQKGKEKLLLIPDKPMNQLYKLTEGMINDDLKENGNGDLLVEDLVGFISSVREVLPGVALGQAIERKGSPGGIIESMSKNEYQVTWFDEKGVESGFVETDSKPTANDYLPNATTVSIPSSQLLNELKSWNDGLFEIVKAWDDEMPINELEALVLSLIPSGLDFSDQSLHDIVEDDEVLEDFKEPTFLRQSHAVDEERVAFLADEYQIPKSKIKKMMRDGLL